MANMSYCLFQNTVSDFENCLDALYHNEHKQPDFSDEEKLSLRRLLRAAKEMVDNFEDEILCSDKP